MKYKTHPLYDESDNKDWLTIDDLIDYKEINESKRDLEEIALNKIIEHMPESYRSENPFPYLNDFRFFLLSKEGYRVFIEYVFSQKEDQNTADSESWWVIINCPNMYGKYVVGFGWKVN